MSDSLQDKIQAAVADGRLPTRFAKKILPNQDDRIDEMLGLTPKPAPVADSYTLYLDLQSEFAYATECELATLEELESKTRTPACSLRRHKGICERMVGVCRKHRISPHPSLPRLSKKLLEMMTIVGRDSL